MSVDKRKNKRPIPLQFRQYLNDAQQHQLKIIESFGWDLKFIRRPMFQKPVAIVTSQDGNSIGVLEEDGRLNLESNIEIRD